MDLRLQAMLDDPVMMVIAAADGVHARIARGIGVRGEGARLQVFVSRSHWPQAVAAIREGAWIALTLCRPATYETYQVKGPVIGPPAAADRKEIAFVQGYIEAAFAELSALGIPPRQMANWLAAEDVFRIVFEPATSFAQTPGPGAGCPLDPLAS